MQAATIEGFPAPIVDGIPVGARRVVFLGALLALPVGVAAFSFGGTSSLASAVVGAALALVNFWLLSRLVVVSTAQRALSASALLARLMGKFALVGVALASAVLLFGLEPLGLLLGLSVVFLAMPLNLLAEWVASAR